MVSHWIKILIISLVYIYAWLSPLKRKNIYICCREYTYLQNFINIYTYLYVCVWWLFWILYEIYANLIFNIEKAIIPKILICNIHCVWVNDNTWKDNATTIMLVFFFVNSIDMSTTERKPRVKVWTVWIRKRHN